MPSTPGRVVRIGAAAPVPVPVMRAVTVAVWPRRLAPIVGEVTARRQVVPVAVFPRRGRGALTCRPVAAATVGVDVIEQLVVGVDVVA